MPQSFTSLQYHVVFSTKNREPAITADLQTRLYEYFGGMLRSEGGVLLAAGGMPDHVHLLMRLTQKHALADVLRIVKTNSSKWVHESFADKSSFAWQTGYGAFTVSTSVLDTVKDYIDKQETHHRRRDFKSEFRELLRKHGIDFDERYLWD
jgi:putative transposase